MYLRRLHLDNVKLLHGFKLDLLRGESPRMWTVLVGKNGTCKTTILQAIALAAAGNDLAAYLMRAGRQDLSRGLRRVGRADEALQIKAELGFGDRGHGPAPGAPEGRKRAYPHLTGARPTLPPVLSVLAEQAPGSTGMKVGSSWLGPARKKATPSPLDAARGSEQLTQDWVALAYGVERNLPRPEQGRSLGVLESRLASIFGAGQLTSTEFHRRFRDRGRPELASHLERILQTVVAATTALVPGLQDIHWGIPEATERRNETLGYVLPVMPVTERQTARLRLRELELAVPLTWLSQGYQSTLGWLADLIGQFIEDADAAIEPADMEGFVLIDELDLHLHPTWQVGIVGALRAVFPRIQFIATTHSPLVTSALQADEVVLLQVEEGRVVARHPETDPRRLTGSELYAQLYGIADSFPGEVGRMAWRYARLAANPYRDDAEHRELIELGKQLRQDEALPDVELRARVSR